MKKVDYILKVEDKKKDLKDDIKTYFDLKIKNDSSNIDILETPYEKEHSGIKKELTIILMILIVFVIRKNGNQLE